VLADGESARGFAWSLESAILAGAVPPVLVVGVHNATVTARSGPDLRTQEYLPGHNRRRFDAHLRFVAGEVVPWAGERYGPVDRPWVASGFSSGAGWAIAAAQRRPDVFGAVAGFSAGVVPQRISRAARSAGIRHYLAAGTCRLLSVRSSARPDRPESAAKPRDLASPAPPPLSTFPQARLSTGLPALTCDFVRIIHKFIHRQLFWLVRRLWVSNESREEAVTSRDALRSGGREVTVMRIAC
jgi:hypothetical protein